MIDDELERIWKNVATNQIGKYPEICLEELCSVGWSVKSLLALASAVFLDHIFSL
jgi:hypothetical protein